MFLEHSSSPVPIPGLVEESFLNRFLKEKRVKNRADKPFGTHPDAREVQHPFTAKAGSAGIHADAASSDVHLRGANGQRSSMKVVTRVGSKLPGGMCATLTFSKTGLLIALCASLRRFELHMFEPKTLKLLAMFPLPNRASTWAMFMTLDPKRIMLDTSGGAYYYLDDEDRVVLADANQHVRRIGHRRRRDDEPAAPLFEFYDVDDWDVNFMIPRDCLTWNNWFPSSNPEDCDPITAVIPDFSGNIWFVTRRGIVGVLDPNKGKVVAKTHLHEEMQNGLTAGEDGVWIVTDRALYCMKLAATNSKNPMYEPRAATDGLDGSFVVQIVWSSDYDRGTFRKVGMLSVGSGTTPTRFDGRFVTITDNKDDQIQLLVYDLKKMKDLIKEASSSKTTSTQKRISGFNAALEGPAPLVCQHGLFTQHQSASDNSMIAVDGSIFMENNFGYHNAIEQTKFSRKHIPGGIERIDLVFENGNSSGAVVECKTVWKSKERAPSCVAKLGQEQGLLYYYTLEDEDDDNKKNNNLVVDSDDDEEAGGGGISSLVGWIFGMTIVVHANQKHFWALTAVDAHTGETIFKVPTGRGRNFDNNWGPVTLGNDGTIYIGVIKGLIAIYDV